jgi:hypothetical protein
MNPLKEPRPDQGLEIGGQGTRSVLRFFGPRFGNDDHNWTRYREAWGSHIESNLECNCHITLSGGRKT